MVNKERKVGWKECQVKKKSSKIRGGNRRKRGKGKTQKKRKETGRMQERN